MEDLAIIVSAILAAVFLVGIAATVFAILFRTGRVSKYWGIGFASILVIFAIISWSGSSVLGMMALGWAILALAIALWPKGK
jgi:hypothetical protein